MRSIRTTRPFLAIIVARRFSPEAFRRGRESGLLCATVDTLLGRSVAEGLATLIRTLQNAAAVAAAKPGVIEDLFSKLGQIEGAAANMRGALFELVVGHLVKKREGSTIDIGRTILSPHTGEWAEIDVFSVKEDQEAWAYECKGKLSSVAVTEEEVRVWMEKKIPRIYSWLKAESRFQNSRLGFEFWTTSEFSNEAVAFLKDAKSRTRKYEIQWKNGREVRECARAVKAPQLVKTLDEHFLRHPVARTLSTVP